MWHTNDEIEDLNWLFSLGRFLSACLILIQVSNYHRSFLLYSNIFKAAMATFDTAITPGVPADSASASGGKKGVSMRRNGGDAGGSGKGMGKAFAGANHGKRHRKVLRDPIAGITKPAIRRLCRRGGVKRLSGMIYEETRLTLKSFLKQTLRDSIIYTAHANRKTVTAMDVVCYALKRQGRQIYGFGGVTKHIWLTRSSPTVDITVLLKCNIVCVCFRNVQYKNCVLRCTCLISRSGIYFAIYETRTSNYEPARTITMPRSHMRTRTDLKTSLTRCLIVARRVSSSRYCRDFSARGTSCNFTSRGL